MSEKKVSLNNDNIFNELIELINLGMFIELIHPQGNIYNIYDKPVKDGWTRRYRLALVNLNCTLPGSKVENSGKMQIAGKGKDFRHHGPWGKKKDHINQLLLTDEKRIYITERIKRFINIIRIIERKIGKLLFIKKNGGTIFDGDNIPKNPDEFNICQHQLPINFHSFLLRIIERDDTLFSFTDDTYKLLKTHIDGVVSEEHQVILIYNFYKGNDEDLNRHRHKIISRLIKKKKAIHNNKYYLNNKTKSSYRKECVNFITLNTVNKTINEIVTSGVSSDDGTAPAPAPPPAAAPAAPAAAPVAPEEKTPVAPEDPGKRPEKKEEEKKFTYMKRKIKWQKKKRKYDKWMQEQKRKEEGMEGLDDASRQELMQLRDQFRSKGNCIIPEDCEDGKTCINFNCVNEDKCENSACNKSVSELTKQNIKLATLPCCNNKICCSCLIDYFSNHANRTEDYRNEKGEYKCPICMNSYLSYDVLRTLCYSEGKRDEFLNEKKYQNDRQKLIEEKKLTELEQRKALENKEVIDRMTEACKIQEQKLTGEIENCNRELASFQAAGEREEQIKQAIEQQFNREMAEHRQKENSSNPNSEENRQRKQNILDLFQRKLQGFKLSDSGFSACPNCGSKILRGGCTDLTDHVADIYDNFIPGDRQHQVLNPPFCPQCGSHAVPKNDHAHRIQNVPYEFQSGRCAATSQTRLNVSPNPVTMDDVPIHTVPGAFWVDQIPELRIRKERCLPWPSEWRNFPNYPLRLRDGSYLNIFAILIEKAFSDKLYPPGHKNHPYYKTYDNTHSSDPLYELISVLDSKEEFRYLISLWPDWTPPGERPNREEIERIVRQSYENPGGEEKRPGESKKQPRESKTPDDFPELKPDLQLMVDQGIITIEQAYNMMFEQPPPLAPAAPAPTWLAPAAPAAPAPTWPAPAAPLAESKTAPAFPQQTPSWNVPQPWSQQSVFQDHRYDTNDDYPMDVDTDDDDERENPCANFDNFLNRLRRQYNDAGRPQIREEDKECRSFCNRENVPGLYHCAVHARQIWNDNFCLGVNRRGRQCGSWAWNCGFCQGHQEQLPTAPGFQYYGGNRCIVINKKKKKKKKTIKKKKIRKAKKTKRKKIKHKRKKTKKNRKQKKRRKTKSNNKKI